MFYKQSATLNQKCATHIYCSNFSNLEIILYCFSHEIIPKVLSNNIWTVKIKIAVVRLVKSLVIFILPGRYL
jgi:hypothetical protein